MKISSRTSLSLATLAFGGLAAVSPVKADPLVVGSGWQNFQFGATGSTAVPTFTYTSANSVLVAVTDAYYAGDSFNVDIDGVLAFATPSVPVNSAIYITDPDSAYANPNFSHASYLAPTGTHTISIITRDSPFGSGGAFIRADNPSPVPEASSSVGLGLMLALGGLMVAARRKKARA